MSKSPINLGTPKFMKMIKWRKCGGKMIRDIEGEEHIMKTMGEDFEK